MRARARAEALVSRGLAVGAALALAALYALCASAEPISALKAFFVAPFASSYALLDFIESAAPLLACALGASVAFRAGAFNLGGEGQAAAGCLAAALVAGAFGAGGGAPAPLAICAALLAAAAAGAALASLSSLAESWSGAEIMLTSFLFSQAAFYAIDWAVGGPLKDPAANLLAMPAIPFQFRLTRLAPPSPLSLAAPLAMALAAATALFQGGTKAGYETKMLGRNALFARASGIDPRMTGRAMAIGGALCGIGGGFLVLGQAGRAMVGMTGGVGWNGLAAALVAGSSALGALPASLFFSWLDAGARQSSILSDLSPDAAAAMKAVALLLITARIDGPRTRRAKASRAEARESEVPGSEAPGSEARGHSARNPGGGRHDG